LAPVLIKGGPNKTPKLSDHMTELHVPGVSIAVIHAGDLEWARGFGVTRAGGAAVTPDTLFQAASISKPVTAMAVLHLAQSGRLDLDADVNQYLKTWKVPANSFTERYKVTLRELLSHTAGMTVHGFPGYASGSSVPTLVQILDGAVPANTKPIRVDAIPGKECKYSGGGYVVVQQLLVDVTGQPFPKLMQDTVLDPAGMAHSTFEQPLPPGRIAEAAQPHLWNGRPVPGGLLTYPEMAPAGLWTTPSDLARYAIAIQTSLAGKTDRVLSASMANEMLTPGLGDYGLGLSIGGDAKHRHFSHGGSNVGYQCFLMAYVDGDGAVIMTNGDDGGELSQEIVRTIAAEYGWPDFRPIEHTIVMVDPESFDGFVGRYRIPPTVVCTITRVGDQFFMQATGTQKSRLYPMSAREFFVTEADVRITFAPEVDGKVPELIAHTMGREVRVPRLSVAKAKALAEPE
jgi:CubicO group peptidase (beta-lactamase class C family)